MKHIIIVPSAQPGSIHNTSFAPGNLDAVLADMDKEQAALQAHQGGEGEAPEGAGHDAQRPPCPTTASVECDDRSALNVKFRECLDASMPVKDKEYDLGL